MFFSRLPRCVVGLEACATAQYWARELGALGHEVRLMPAQYVKPYVRRNKCRRTRRHCQMPQLRVRLNINLRRRARLRWSFVPVCGCGSQPCSTKRVRASHGGFHKRLLFRSTKSGRVESSACGGAAEWIGRLHRLFIDPRSGGSITITPFERRECVPALATDGHCHTRIRGHRSIVSCRNGMRLMPAEVGVRSGRLRYGAGSGATRARFRNSALGCERKSHPRAVVVAGGAAAVRQRL